MIIYLSGPMSGLPDKNKPTFNKWAKLFRQRGHQVINPAENDGGSTDKEWSFYMRLDIESMLQVEAVVVLPGWEYSTGSKIELTIANALNIPCYHVEDFTVNRLKPMRLGISTIVTES